MSILRDKANLVVTAKARKAGKLYAYNPQLTTGTGHPEFTVDRNCKRSEIDSELYIRQIAPYMPAFSWVDGKPTIDTQPASTNQYLFPFAAENNYSIKSGLSVELDADTSGSELVTDGGSETNVFSLGGYSADINCTTSVSANYAHSGTNSAKIVAAAAGVTYRNFGNDTVLIYGKSYHYNAWVYFPVSLTNNNITIYNVNTNGIDVIKTIIVTPGQWTYISIEFYALTSNYLRILYAADNAGDTIYVDDVSVKEVQGFNSPFKDSTGNIVKCGRKLVESDASAGSIAQSMVNSIFGTPANSTLSETIIVKPNGRYILFRISDNLTGVVRAVFDFENNTIKYDAIGDWTNPNATFKKLADGYYALSITGTKGSSTDTIVQLYLQNAYSLGVTSYTGDGVSGVYIAGIQFETGNPTAFINDPESIEGSTAGRLGEVDKALMTIPTDDITLFLNGKYTQDNHSGFSIGIDDNTSYNAITLIPNYYNAYYISCYFGTSNKGEGVKVDFTKSHKTIATIKNKIFKLFIDGILMKTIDWSTYSFTVTNFNVASFSSMANTNYQSPQANIETAGLLFTALTDEEAIELTTL